MNIDDSIFVNQIAQGIVQIDEGERWFSAFDLETKRNVIREISSMVLQAHPLPEDAALAIAASGLRKTLTPSVILLKPNIKVQLAKLANLPEREFPNVFRLLVKLLGIADKRRRETRPLDTINHWWHRDLSNPGIVEEIRQRYRGARQSSKD